MCFIFKRLLAYYAPNECLYVYCLHDGLLVSYFRAP